MFVSPLTRASSSAASDSLPFPDRWFAWTLAGSFVLLLALLGDTRLHVDPFSWAALPIDLWLVLTAVTAWIFRDGRGRTRRVVRNAAYDYALFTAMALMGAIGSYPVAALSHGFVDGSLQRTDALLHFDWLAWYEAVAAHPVLQIAGHIAYQSVYLSPALLLGHFAVTERRDRTRLFLASTWVAAVLTLVLYAAMPAVGPFALEWHGAIPYMPDSALWQPELIPALREHTLHRIDLGSLRGLVSAPSFHTAAAVLYIRAAWPLRRLRWPLLLLNAAMLLSTPVEGTHYLTDMLLGALVAAVAITAVEALAVRVMPGRAAPALRWRG